VVHAVITSRCKCLCWRSPAFSTDPVLLCCDEQCKYVTTSTFTI